MGKLYVGLVGIYAAAWLKGGENVVFYDFGAVRRFSRTARQGKLPVVQRTCVICRADRKRCNTMRHGPSHGADRRKVPMIIRLADQRHG